MKTVLLLIESNVFREYLSSKIYENGIDVTIANNPLDGIAKMRNTAPDLLVLDYDFNYKALMELLKQKKLDANVINAPVIIIAHKLEQKQLLELVPYNVKRVFNKPIKIDAFYATLSEILNIPFSIDENPGIVEVHVNENIVFIEIAKGLNRDKLELLHYKLSELINLYKIRFPKIIVMLSDTKLGLSDSPNIQKLLNTVFQASKARPSYIRLLTRDDFVRQYINEQKEYAEIKVLSNLSLALDDLLSEKDRGKDYEAGERAEIIGDKILQAEKKEDDEENMVLKFDAEERKISHELFKESVHNLKIAVIDDDFVIQELIKHTFAKTNSWIFTYDNGEEFLADVDKQEFDLAFLDLIMPKVDGFAVLTALEARNIHYPVIVLSSVSQREAMIKAIKMGVRSYLVKPLKPEDIFMKSLEILKANF